MAELPRILVLIGSGETAAQMARVHRWVITRLARAAGQGVQLRAAVIDTPYGFQENADSLSAELVDFFRRRLGLDASLASLRRVDGDAIARESAYEVVRDAQFVFAGPGSPSYALKQWAASDMPQIFADKLEIGGAVVLASAAALTIGAFTPPIYEIYRVGEDPLWLPGLDVLARLGIRAVVIPHWDNSAGTDHDTRYCFLGERRFLELERQLPDDVHVIGIGEHTALVVDLDSATAEVRGRGRVVLRRHGDEVSYGPGEQFTLDALIGATVKRPTRATLATDSAGGNQVSLAREVVTLRGIADDLRTRAELVEPLLDELINVRNAARVSGDYQTADRIRARLTALGVEISDAADGSTSLRLPD